jgi:hypothetical protein
VRLPRWLKRKKPGDSVTPDAELPAECGDWRQGDVFATARAFVVNAGGTPVEHPCPQGVAIVSQSCDAAQPGRRTIQVAPVVTLADAMANEARSGKRPQYAHLASLGGDRFANLDVVTTADKASLVGLDRVRGVEHDDAIRRFAGSVARKYGRFAYPDEVVRCLDPMRVNLSSRAHKPKSPLGQVLQKVYGVRVESKSGWAASPYDLTLIVITQPGALPFGDPHDDLPDEPDGLAEQICGPQSGTLNARITSIATHLLDATVDVERYWAWHYMAAAWTEQCAVEADKHNLRGVVRSIDYDLAAVDEFPLSRVNSTEALDLDYLSPPLPRDPQPND